ncbi:MAG: S49 family peptidase [Planctomycetes bacterium]|nr:S49 family peptidase [Planctomycetota bacterium]
MNLLDAILANGWAMSPSVLTQLVRIVERHEAGEKLPAADVNAIVAGRDQLFADRMSAFGLLPPSADKGSVFAAIEEGPMAPSVVVDSVAQGKAPLYFMVGDVAVVPVQGVLAKHSSMVNGMSQPVGMAYSQVARAVALAENDPKAKSILLDIHSPGGTVAGVQDAYAEIEKAAKAKPVLAYAHDMAASGAYWLAAAADKIVLSPSAEVGSIGVYQVHDDTSKQLADRKINRTVISSGPHKGAGAGGLPLNADQLAGWQAEVNSMARAFASYVGARRGLAGDKLNNVTDGRVFVGQDAVDLGLADGVATPRQAIEMARQMSTTSRTSTPTPTPTPTNRTSPSISKEAHMFDWTKLSETDIKDMPKDVAKKIGAAHGMVETPTSTPTPAPAPAATFEQLDAAFPEDSDQVRASLKAKHTLEQAKADNDAKKIASLTTQLAAANASVKTLQSRVSELESKTVVTAHGGPRLGSAGTPPLSTPTPGADDAMAAVQSRVTAIKAEKNIDANRAIALMATGSDNDRTLHKAWRTAGCPAIK